MAIGRQNQRTQMMGDRIEAESDLLPILLIVLAWVVLF
jgi:hypothetical protein